VIFSGLLAFFFTTHRPHLGNGQWGPVFSKTAGVFLQGSYSGIRDLALKELGPSPFKARARGPIEVFHSPGGKLIPPRGNTDILF